MTLDNIQDLEVLRTVAKMHEKESLKLRGQLAEAVAKLHGKDAGLAKQLSGPESERSERPSAKAKNTPTQTGSC